MKSNPRADAAGCLVLLIVSPISSIWSGYVLSLLWAWFIVAAFEIRPLSIPAAIGIALIARYLTYQWNVKEPDYESASHRTYMSISMAILYPAFALAFGYIAHLFM